MLGFRSRRQLRLLPVSDYRDWLDYYAAHPSTNDSVEQGIAILCCLVANMLRDRNSAPLQPAQFRAVAAAQKPRFDLGSLGIQT